MVVRLLDIKDDLLEIMENHNHDLILPTDSDWTKLSVLKGLLKPCEEAIKLLGGDKYVTASIVLPIMAHLKKAMKEIDDDAVYATRFKKKFLEDFLERCVCVRACVLKLYARLKPVINMKLFYIILLAFYS